MHIIYFPSFYFPTNCRSKKNEEEKKKMSESVLRYHDQIAAQTTNISKLKEDLTKEQQSKCLLEERLSKVGNQTVFLNEEIVQLKAMSNVNCYHLMNYTRDLISILIYVFGFLGICLVSSGTLQIKRQVSRSRTSARRVGRSVEKRNIEIKRPRRSSQQYIGASALGTGQRGDQL